ncbi:MAG TPA: CsbD family protein [Candidatus Thermoplasmatota archaeon]
MNSKGAQMGEYKDKIKGKAKQIVGRATGNRRMEGEGLVLQGRGAVRRAGKDVKRELKRRIGRSDDESL